MGYFGYGRAPNSKLRKAQTIMQAGMRAMDEPITDTMEQAASVPVHPEEMKAIVDLRIGNSVSLKATARTTPAGLVTAGIMVSGIILAVATLIWAVRRQILPKDAFGPETGSAASGSTGSACGREARPRR